MILVTGSTGKTGRAVIQVLTKNGEAVRAFAHQADDVTRLKSLGVEDVIVGDLLNPSDLERSVRNVRAVYHIAPNISPDEVTIGKMIVSAAKPANVERFVFHSVLHPQIEAMPHHWQKLRVEEFLIESGLSFTILQPTIYMQNVLAYWDKIIKNGTYQVPYSPEASLSMVDLNDVAQVAAMVLAQPSHEGAVYELVGVSAISSMEVTNILSEQLNRSVTVKVVPLDEWERNARSSGMGSYQVLTLIKMFCYYENHGFRGNLNSLGYLLGRQPTSFAEFVNRIKRDD